MHLLFFRFFLWLLGWKTSGRVPKEIKKSIAIVVPHTSNWDFPIGVAGRPLLGLSKCKYLAKKSLFDSSIGKLFYWLGGIPVDRSANNHLVDQIVDHFEKNEEFHLAITPEGTRGKVKRWKTGFYQMALEAKVPVMLCFIDYHKKEVGVGPAFYPTGEKEKDLEEIYAYYKNKMPLYPKDSSIQHDNLPVSVTNPVKLVLKSLLIALITFLLFNWELAWYGIQQARGQANVLWNAQPVATYLESDDYPDELKKKSFWSRKSDSLPLTV